MTFSIDNPRGDCNNPPLGKYVWEKPSGEQGLIDFQLNTNCPSQFLRFFTVKSPSVTQRSVYQENAYKKS